MKFSEGDTIQNIIIRITDDDDMEENDETFTAEIMNNPNITLGTPSVTTITILDDEGN